jgi:predicted metal-binding protein
MIPKATIKTFIRHARELGALEAKLIEAASIVTAPWVRWKCKYGCGGYDTSLCCPPIRSPFLSSAAVMASFPTLAAPGHFNSSAP